MELSRELIIDALLNVAAYLTAGAFWLVLHSLVVNRSRQAAANMLPATVTEDKESRNAASANRRAQYVSLSTGTPGRDSDSEERGRLRDDATRYQRNRAEVIRLAREMLRSGTHRDKVRSLLPISEGELALLANE